MDPAAYDAWYSTPRGRWIGDAEYRLAWQGLRARPGETLLDVGCGTGWFSRRAAADGLHVTALDPNAAWLDYARGRGGHPLDWVIGDARALPFADASFDHVLSIAALCFIDDERAAVAECVRVARKRIAIGWLNRHSLLHRQKAQGGGAYRGARWHTARELRALVSGLPLRNVQVRSTVFLPAATSFAVMLERGLPKALPWGSLLVLTGEKSLSA